MSQSVSEPQCWNLHYTIPVYPNRGVGICWCQNRGVETFLTPSICIRTLVSGPLCRNFSHIPLQCLLVSATQCTLIAFHVLLFKPSMFKHRSLNKDVLPVPRFPTFSRYSTLSSTQIYCPVHSFPSFKSLSIRL